MGLREALKRRLGWCPEPPRSHSVALPLDFTKRTATTLLLVTLIASLGTLVGLKLDLDRRDAVLWFVEDQGAMQGFRKVEELTPPGSVVLCWWDYGRGVEEISHRSAVEKYPSREIWDSTGSSRDFLWET